MHNPNTEIARLIAREPVRTRKPEQGTGPNVYYLGAEEAAINPEIAIEELPHMTMWSTLLKPDQYGQSAIDKNMSLPALKTINPLTPIHHPNRNPPLPTTHTCSSHPLTTMPLQ